MVYKLVAKDKADLTYFTNQKKRLFIRQEIPCEK